MVVDQQPDITQRNADGFDVAFNLAGVFRQGRIEQDGALPGYDQIGRQPLAADIVDVVDNLEGFGRCRPCRWISGPCRTGHQSADQQRGHPCAPTIALPCVHCCTCSGSGCHCVRGSAMPQMRRTGPSHEFFLGLGRSADACRDARNLSAPLPQSAALNQGRSQRSVIAISGTAFFTAFAREPCRRALAGSSIFAPICPEKPQWSPDPCPCCFHP